MPTHPASDRTTSEDFGEGPDLQGRRRVNLAMTTGQTRVAGVPSSCFGETEYFIIAARPIGQ
jgi:hypothetical protein